MPVDVNDIMWVLGVNVKCVNRSIGEHAGMISLKTFFRFAALKKSGGVFLFSPALDYHGLRRPYVAFIVKNMHWFEAEKKKISQC
ncbi:MAG: hypothetical protein KAT62_13360 [Desulfuromonadales bacterium]|nr:hypothetical protein [Desulfuromonadales bacterium]